MKKTPDLLIFSDFRFLDTASEQNKVPFLNDPENSSIKGLSKSRDLSYGEAISVSSYANKNGYYFSNEFLLKNYKSLLYKPMNVGHNKNKIIGVIYDVAIIGQNSRNIIDVGKIAFDIEGKPANLGDDLDVHIKFALFNWLFPETIEEIRKGIDEDNPESAKYKVSMEIWPIKYGYNFNKDESTFTEKTEENKFLDRYVGLEYQGKYISRQYIDADFAGTGFVEFPANDRSLILDLSAIEDSNKQLLEAASRDLSRSNERAHVIGDKIVIDDAQDKDKEKKFNTEKNAEMDNKVLTKEEIEQIISDKFSSIEATINTAMFNDKSLKEQEAREKVLNQEITNSTKRIAELQNELNQANDSLAVSKTTQEEFKSVIQEVEKDKTSMNEKIESLQKQLNEANEIVKQFQKKEIGEQRLAELGKINVVYSEDKKAEKVDRFGLMSDEAWNSFYADMKDLKLQSDTQVAANKTADNNTSATEEGDKTTDNSAAAIPQSGSPDSAGILNGKEQPMFKESGNSRKVISLITPRGQKAFEKTGTK